MTTKMPSATTTTNTNTTTNVPTPQESAMESLQLGQMQATNPLQTQTQLSGLGISNQLLQGSTNLPGFFNNLYQGVDSSAHITNPGDINAQNYQIQNPGNLNSQNFQIQNPGNINSQNYQVQSPGYINPSNFMIGSDQTQALTNEALRNITPQFQKMGVLDSGSAATVAGRVAGDISRNSYQQNLNTALGITQGNISQNLGIQNQNIDRGLGIEQGNIARDLGVQQQNQGINYDVAQGNIARNLGIQQQNIAQGYDIASQNVARNLGVQQYNVDTARAGQSFNVSNVLNLLNQAMGGQAQVQQPVLSNQQMLGQNLAGLRTTNSSGSSNSTGYTSQINPFVQAAAQLPGQTINAMGLAASGK